MTPTRLISTWGEYRIKMIVPSLKNRSQTQNGRALRRHKRRWVVERLFARLQWFRGLVARYEVLSENFLGMGALACIKIVPSFVQRYL
jgi:transposase